MDSDVLNLLKRIYSDDIVYHYTKASTAIDYILYNKQLKFSEAKKSNDPIESCNDGGNTMFSGYIDMNERIKKTTLDAQNLHDFRTKQKELLYQISFCKNCTGEGFAEYITDLDGYEEFYGFLKPRMWDQYADKYTGVCIAFSMKKILSLNDTKLNLMKDDVKYLTYQKIKEKKPNDINGNILAKIGKEEYQKYIENNLIEEFFWKHVDYEGENEYRIATLHYENKYYGDEFVRGKIVHNKTIMLDISGCIEVVFMSNYANEKQKEELLEYANKLNFPLIEIEWKENEIKLKEYKKWISFLHSLKK